MIEEQLLEADRALAPHEEPLLPYTYAWLKRLDRACGIYDADSQVEEGFGHGFFWQ